MVTASRQSCDELAEWLIRSHDTQEEVRIGKVVVMINKYITRSFNKSGSHWHVLRWNGENWSQVGPYYDTEAEAIQARLDLMEAESV
jgi:hypothetical protein